MKELQFPFWIQKHRPTRGDRAADWETLADFETEDEARMALADSDAYPLDRPIRIVQVTVIV